MGKYRYKAGNPVAIRGPGFFYLFFDNNLITLSAIISIVRKDSGLQVNLYYIAPLSIMASVRGLLLCANRFKLVHCKHKNALFNIIVKLFKR